MIFCNDAEFTQSNGIFMPLLCPVTIGPKLREMTLSYYDQTKIPSSLSDSMWYANCAVLIFTMQSLFGCAYSFCCIILGFAHASDIADAPVIDMDLVASTIKEPRWVTIGAHEFPCYFRNSSFQEASYMFAPMIKWSFHYLIICHMNPITLCS